MSTIFSPVFVAAIAISAFLLFWVQFMVGKLLLPVLGGAPAVWNTCMVFFQVLLLAGYGYVHGVTRWCKPRTQVWLTVGLLVAGGVCLPLSPPLVELSQSNNAPVVWLLTYLLTRVGLPVLGLTVLAPLLQVWFRDCRGVSPYWLYGASNAASLTSLLVYPTVLEAVLPLTQQIYLWAVGYGVLVVLVAGCGYYRWQVNQINQVNISDDAPDLSLTEISNSEHNFENNFEKNSEKNSEKKPQRNTSSRQPWLSWLILAAIPSSLLLGVTTHITTDITPMPLLWALPLAVYLCSWVLVFAEYFLPLIAQLLTPLVLIGLMLTATFGFLPTLWLVGFQIIGFGWVCWALHGRLVALRPAPADLTKFYLMIALGGALGGSFNSLLAPIWFRTLIEYPLILGLAVLWLPIPQASGSHSSHNANYRNVMLFQIGLTLSVLSLALNAPINGKLIAQGRSFFGTYRVTEDNGRRIFAHGTTIHGVQYENPDQQREPLSYFSSSSPVSLVINTMQPQPQRVGVVGLGIGTLATYGRAGQNWTFYEIDPLVANLAQQHFTYLEQSRAKINLIIGDGRLALAARGQRVRESQEIPYDLLILDAFSSDAVPTHLLTKEALQIYLENLSPQGVIAYNVTNRYLDLAPILANLAQNQNLKVRFCRDRQAATGKEKQANIFPSQWVIMARQSEQIPLILANPDCQNPSPSAVSWSDDFSSVLQQIRWR
ncbi:MAG: spermidine synthase [Pseudanabaenaceae cyanobacterium]